MRSVNIIEYSIKIRVGTKFLQKFWTDFNAIISAILNVSKMTVFRVLQKCTKIIAKINMPKTYFYSNIQKSHHIKQWLGGAVWHFYLKTLFILYLYYLPTKHVNSILSSAGVHNSNLIAGPKFFFDISKGQSWYVLTHSKGVFIKRRSKMNQIGVSGARLKAPAGHIWPACRLLCMPGLVPSSLVLGV